jgi:RNA polymerase sigma-54 factor
MQKLGLSQTLSQKLSPQQIQFIKLLQVPTAELEARIEEELETNPALEEGKEENSDDLPEEEYEETDYENDEINVEDYLRDDDFSGYKMQGDGSAFEEREMPIATSSSLPEQLLSQLGFLGLDERQTSIGTQLIGSIENDGYIRRDLEAIINDLAFSMNIETSL